MADLGSTKKMFAEHIFPLATYETGNYKYYIETNQPQETTMSFNVTISLADQYAAAKAAADAATEALDALKAQIKASGIERHIGVTCDVVLALSEQRRVDNKLLAEFLTEDQIESCKKPILVERITIKPKGIK